MALVAGYTVTDIRSLGISGNVTLYASIVVTNVIRTTVLSIVNIITAIYLLVNVYSPITLYILWPVTSICLLVLIGYDTNITNAMRRIKSNSEQSQNNDQKHHTARNSLTNDFSSIPHSTRKIVRTRRNNEFGFNEDDLEMIQESSSQGQQERVRPEPIQQNINPLEDLQQDHSQEDSNVPHTTVMDMPGPSTVVNSSESLKTY
ncbi:hypothetical protein HPULCUR_002068 [Helicostylum pulchrum]|uniref:Uncharacterized protein n=1 Tax=Helicostylum pulchrum TaxID=562976 RepID=A0ABP9XPL5_9FUNG